MELCSTEVKNVEDEDDEVENIEDEDEEVENAEDKDDEVEKSEDGDDEKNNNKNYFKSRSKSKQVKCGYKGCQAKPMLEQNLERHTVTEHRGKVTKVKGQTTIQSFFGKRRGDDPKDDASKPKKDKSDFDEEETETDPDNPQEVVENEDEEVAEEKAEEVSTGSLTAAVIMEIKEAVKTAVKEAIGDKETDKEPNDGDATKEVKTEQNVMRSIRSVKEIAVKFPEFEYCPETKGNEFMCVVCSRTFSYSTQLEQDFGSEILSDKFRNLKKHMMRHLESSAHKIKAEADEAEAAKWVKQEKRNKAVGLTVGRIVYHLIHKGRPDEDFTDMIYLSAAGGSDCGDINHSKKFVGKFLPHLAAAVRRRMKEMLGTRMVATDCLPPVNLIADKATHQRETRQLVGCITVNTQGKELLVSLLLGIPKCAGGTGDQLCDSILSTTEGFTVPQQVAGFSADGVYNHCGVTEKMERKLGKKILYTWDPMHKAALTDTALRSGKKEWTKKFEWIVEMTSVIGKGVNFVAWGKSWAEFFKVCEELKKEPETVFKMKRPSGFSETKFANHAHDVYEKFRNNFRALNVVLEKTKERRNNSSDEKKKAESADEIQGKIWNWLFAISLSMVTDVYKVYASISLVLQKVDILPHEKYDIYKKLLNKLGKMLENIPYSNCPCMVLDPKDKELKELQEELCLWPRFHEDVNAGLDRGMYQNLPMGMVRAEEYRTRAGDKENKTWLQVEVEGVVGKVEKRAEDLVTFLEKGLREKVYTYNDVEVVEKCRLLLDVRCQAEKVRERGAGQVSSLGFKTFKAAALYFEPRLDLRLDPDDLKLQWRRYNDVLEDLISRKPSTSSKDFIKLMIDPEEELYHGIQGVLSVMVQALVTKGGVESVVESMVSVVEAHTPSNRVILNQERLEDEVVVAWNGEDVYHCDPVVQEALKTYWSKSKDRANREGHFVRRKENIRSYVTSEAVDSQAKKPPKLPFMMKK